MATKTKKFLTQSEYTRQALAEMGYPSVKVICLPSGTLIEFFGVEAIRTSEVIFDSLGILFDVGGSLMTVGDIRKMILRNPSITRVTLISRNGTTRTINRPKGR